MEGEHFEIQNDIGLSIRGEIHRPKPKGTFPLIILVGDLFDARDAPHLKETAKLLLEKGFAVARFDPTNGFGDSDGRGEDATVSQHARDIEDVLLYCKRRSYVKKVSLLGYGMGGMAAIVLEGFKSLASGLVAVNAPMEVTATAWTSFPERELTRIKLKRYFHVQRAGGEVRINYTLFEDGGRIDMARCTRNLTTPVLYIAGRQDTIVPLESSEWLHDRTAGKKQLLIMEDLGHVDSRKGVKGVVEAAVKFLKAQKVA